MTLSTNVYVLDEVDVRELFQFAQRLLTTYDDRPIPQSPDQQVWRDEERSDIWNEPGTRVIRNELGQGLPAILDIAYGPDGPLRTAEQAAQHDEDCNLPGNKYYDPDNPDCDGDHYRRACWADLDLDTAYGYRDSRGWGCGDLHAVLVAEIGKWLDERGVRWEWKNEFTGEVHGGDDRYERLIELVSGGFEASAWLRAAALPAIAAGMLDTGTES